MTRKYEIAKVDRVEKGENNDVLNEIGTDIPLAILEDSADLIKKLFLNGLKHGRKEFETYIIFIVKILKTKELNLLMIGVNIGNQG